MRIAIYENLPLGGARRVSFELGRRLASDHHVDMYRLSAFASEAMDLAPLVDHAYEYRFAPLLGALGGRVRTGRLAPRSYTAFGPLKRLQKRIARDIEERGYDVVLAHTDGITQSPYLLRWLTTVPSVYFCEEVLRVANETALLKQHRAHLREAGRIVGALRTVEDVWVIRRLIHEDRRNVAAAATLVVNSGYSRQQVWAAYARDSTVCRLGVDPARFRPGRSEDREREVLSIGSPIATKGHTAVVEALALLEESIRPRLRVIAPRDAGLPALEKLAAARGVQLVAEIGVDEEALVARYQRASATVCAARLEPFGLTALESMACATPVVAYREGGYQESIADGETGFLVEPDPPSLAQAIRRMCTDPRLANSIGREARRRVESSWTWGHSAARLERILESAAERPPDRLRAAAA